MQIAGRDIDDFKTERKDITPPLAAVMRLVPILFYGASALALIVGTISFIQIRIAAGVRDEHVSQAKKLEGEIKQAKTDRTSLEDRIRRSADLEAWVLASMPLQPLVVQIARSISPRSSIVDLSLERDTDNPAQLKLGLRLNTDSDKQLEQTLQVIRDMYYREFSPTQTMVRGDLDYKATLVWQSPQSLGESALPPPAPTETP